MPFFTSNPSRRTFLRNSVMAGAAAVAAPALSAGRAVGAPAKPAATEVTPFELEEITISELQDGMKSGQLHGTIAGRKVLGAHRRNRYSA